MSKGNPKMAEIKNQIKPSYRGINANLLIFTVLGQKVDLFVNTRLYTAFGRWTLVHVGPE